MKRRFSWLAFIVATLIHLTGTSALFAADFRALAESRDTGVYPHLALFTALSWIWDPLPKLVNRWCGSRISVNSVLSSPVCRLFGPSFILWALCIGLLFGFLVPRICASRRAAI
jgi:hypothetical protein